MADPDFPTLLGSPTINGYGYQDQKAEIVTTQMESGTPRRRQRSKNIPSDFSYQFVFDDIKLGMFEYFNQVILSSLTSRFNIDIKTGQGIVTHNVKYTEAPNISKIGKVFQVSCKVEAKARPTS